MPGMICHKNGENEYDPKVPVSSSNDQSCQISPHAFLIFGTKVVIKSANFQTKGPENIT
jgi:hypothetical protein